MRELWRDVVVGARLFRRSPGLAAAVAVTIGVGVGGSLAIFGLLHDTLIGRPPFADAGRLVIVENTGRYYYEGRFAEGRTAPAVSGPDYGDIEAQTRTLAPIGAFAGFSGVMTGGDRPRPVWRTLVSAQLFPLLDARPRLGRLLQRADFNAGAPLVAVLTESMWRRHFGADAGVVGRTIRIDDQALTVVGVAPDAILRFLRQSQGLLDQVQDRQVISPLLLAGAGSQASLFKFLQRNRDAPWLSVIGRLAPGRTLAQARSEISVIARRLAAEHPATNARRGLQASGLEEWRTINVRRTTLMLFVAALLVFLVASCNAAGLILADSARRETEVAVRQALGASSARLVRYELVRSMLLVLPGGLLAVALAAVTLLIVDRTLAGGSGTILRTLLVPRVIGAGALITAVSGLIAGASVAWSMRRRRLAEALKEGGLTVSAGRRRHVVTRTLVALQVVAATALVLGAGLMLRSVWNIVGVNLGFDVQHSVVVQVRLPPSRYKTGKDQREFFLRTLQRVRALPGVTSAGVALAAPLTHATFLMSGLEIETSRGEKRTPEFLNAQPVMPGYFEAMDLKLRRGRWFSERDYAGGESGIVVDESFCRKYLAGTDPLQARIRFERGSAPIVGVVGDVHRNGPLENVEDTLYRLEPFDRPQPWAFLVVRAAGNPGELGGPVLREILAADPAVSTDDPRTVKELFADTFATRRRLLVLLAGASTVVLLLTAFSLVSAFGQFVSGRRRDLAIRLALGAEGRHVTALLGRFVAAALAVGLGAGLCVGFALARTLSAELFGVAPTDPLTFVEALGAIALVAAIAAAGPIWRARRIDPAITLRSQ